MKFMPEALCLPTNSHDLTALTALSIAIDEAHNESQNSNEEEAHREDHHRDNRTSC
jgi:hypothetical protein